MKINVYSVDQQATGSFDGGTITERKPIGFPREGSAVTRIGSLFYWAWAFAEQEGYIDSHPHQAFEILTYVVQGEAHHGDSLGTKSIVGKGGVQLIQAGSGVSHNERLVGPKAELFQIWFEPHIAEALKRPPAYSQYEHEQFTSKEQDGVLIKTVIGEDAPIQLVADAQMWDMHMNSGATYNHVLKPNRALAVLAVQGDSATMQDADKSVQFLEQDFVVVESDQAVEQNIRIQAGLNEGSRLILIEVPIQVDYPLYPKRR
ncbi:pirin [Paenibacillus albiflavus]|uniref:Pirin n=1 Tax=Paenibacillus albiflavus TaxID=2545760 RepID=A0A4R4EDM4_9BACL|nr:pirin family protein [Paenibacillus albiflavus]TCZ76095.1 pirin [Paenibacillus albiflavus]